MKKTPLLLLLAALGALLVHLVWPDAPSGVRTEPGPDAGPLAVEAPPLAVETPPVPQRRVARAIGDTLPDWAEAELLHGRGAEQEDPGDGEPTCALKGSLGVKGKPWIPIPGMRMRLTTMWLDTVILEDRKQLDDALFLEPEARTDERGRFLIEGVPLRHDMFLVVQGEIVHEVIELNELPLPGETKDLGDVPFEERGEVRGLVVDDRGAPLSGMDVRAVDDIHNRGAYADALQHDARVLAAATYDPAGRRHGREQRVAARRRDRFLPFPRAVTGRDGSFALRGVRAGEVTLFLNSARHHGVRDAVPVIANQATDLGVIALDAPSTLWLKIVDEQRRPVARAAVSVQPGAWAVSAPTLRTDDRGNCSVAIPGGTFSVAVRPQGERLWMRCGTGHEAHDPRDRGAKRLTLPGKVRLRLRATDAAERDLPDAEVAVFATDQVEGGRVRLGWSTADERDPGGWHTFEVGRWTAVDIVASAPGFAPSAHALNVFNEQDLRLRLHPAPAIEVRTVDPDGRPLPDVKISGFFVRPPVNRAHTALGDDWHVLTRYRPVDFGRTDGEARLAIPLLCPGRIDLAAEHPRYTQTMTKPFDVEPGLVVTIKMKQMAHFEGRLLIDGATPLRHHRITAIPEDALIAGVEVSPFLERRAAMTADDGSFSFRDLYEGPWVLRVGPRTRSPWPAGESRTVFAQRGTTWHTMNLERPRSKFTVRGRVRLTGRPFDGPLIVGLRPCPGLADLGIEPPRDTPHLRRWRESPEGRRAMDIVQRARAAERQDIVAAPVGSDGRFALPVSKPGTYAVELRTVFGGRPQTLGSREVRVAKGAGAFPAEADFALATGDVRLVLTGSDGAARPNCVLDLQQRGDAPRGARLRVCSDAEGVVYLRGIPAGAYEAEHHYDGAGAQRPAFDVAPATLSHAHLKLR